jgi:hypothetical protein
MSNEKARCVAAGGLGHRLTSQSMTEEASERACAGEENQMAQVNSGLSSAAPRQK